MSGKFQALDSPDLNIRDLTTIIFIVSNFVSLGINYHVAGRVERDHLRWSTLITESHTETLALAGLEVAGI